MQIQVHDDHKGAHLMKDRRDSSDLSGRLRADCCDPLDESGELWTLPLPVLLCPLTASVFGACGELCGEHAASFVLRV